MGGVRTIKRKAFGTLKVGFEGINEAGTRLRVPNDPRPGARVRGAREAQGNPATPTMIQNLYNLNILMS